MKHFTVLHKIFSYRQIADKSFSRALSVLVLVFVMTTMLQAQTISNDKNLLQGRWKLEEVSVNELNDTILLNPQDYNVTTYPEIEIRGKELLFTYKGVSQKTECKIEESVLYLDFIDTSYVTDWAISKDKLYIQWMQDIVDISTDEPKALIFLLVYKRR